MKEHIRESKMFYSIFDGVIFRNAKSEEKTEQRTITKKDGTLYTKEGVFIQSLEGKITNIKFRNQEFSDGSVLFLEIEIDNEGVLSINWESRYAKNIAGRLMNEIDFTKPIIIAPYNFVTDGKRNTGMMLKQGDVKFGSYYRDLVNKKNINGLESLDKFITEKMDGEDWKVYFIKAGKFLKEQIKDKLIPKFENQQTPAETTVEDLPEDDLPF